MPTSLLPVSAVDYSTYTQSQFRASRTDLDFEQALRQDGTVRIKESVDVSSLGMDVSQNSPFSTPRGAGPNFIVPTSPINQPTSASRKNAVFNEQEDAERRSNRRSIYRSAGTSSSPDLATLVRKAKERGVVYGTNHYSKEKYKESAPPLPGSQERPNTANANTRPRSSTSQSLNPLATPTSPSSHTGGRDKLARGALTDVVPEWFMTSPRPRKDEAKALKNSVRHRTSELLGKMLGQHNSKDKMRSTPYLGLTKRPVHQTSLERNGSTSRIPEKPVTISAGSTSIADDSITPRASPSGKRDHPDGPSVVLVGPSPRSDGKDRSPEPPFTGSSAPKRRSMSVGDADTKKPISRTPSPSKFRNVNNTAFEDTTLHGIINDFRGQLSSLDPMNSEMLDLRDPSTPARRLAYRSKVGNTSSSGMQGLGEVLSTRQAQPKLHLGIEQGKDNLQLTSTDAAPIVPPRLSSLAVPPSPASSVVSSAFRSTVEEGPGPLKGRNDAVISTFRDPNRLNVLHRPTASNSEPSLVHVGNNSYSPHVYNDSQHELTAKEPTLTRLSSNLSIGGDVASDIETHGKELASRCWNEDITFLAREKIAEYLGGQGYINKVALRHYISFFDFSGLRLDLAFRHLCSKLYLKAETQQVDRILEEFSKRYWECNTSSLYGSASIVHAVTYSLLLLNTDLHVADLSTHMSRSQFVRNTLAAIQAHLQTLVEDTLPGESEKGLPSARSADSENVGRTKRSDSIASWNSVSRDVVMTLPLPFTTHHPQQDNNENTSLVTDATNVEATAVNSGYLYSKGWENDMEAALKEMYNAIRAQQILQPLNNSTSRLSVSSLSASTGMLRNRSLRSQSDRLTTLKRGSVRGLHSIMAQAGTSQYSNGGSIDGRMSPSPSLATSTHEFHCSSSSFLTPALGFASNLSSTIIREAHEDDGQSIASHDTTSTSISISDEELALLGAPWAKEGILCRKQYWESTGKRAKDRSWLDVFVVIQKGELNMFTFNGSGTAVPGNVIGGGNWLANANHVGTVLLTHSLAHSLPPPGYNRQRPHCMVLTLANGGVYFFQAGTEELVNEWVSTCNYWAARTSKEPLAGGVSNMEYGWNRVTKPHTYGRILPDDESPRDTDHSDTLSVRSSRSNRSRFGWREGVATVRHGSSPWADRTFINDWKAPLPPTVASTHDEETQLEALRKHVNYLKNELEHHNELREPMTALYQPRTATALKAQSNWEKKSQYLLTEIVKYESYIDSLQGAMNLRLKKRGEKALERALDGVIPSDPTEVTPIQPS